LPRIAKARDTSHARSWHREQISKWRRFGSPRPRHYCRASLTLSSPSEASVVDGNACLAFAHEPIKGVADNARKMFDGSSRSRT